MPHDQTPHGQTTYSKSAHNESAHNESAHHEAAHQESALKTRRRPRTELVRGGLARSGFDETSEGLFLTSGYIYPSAEDAEAAFKGDLKRYQYSRYANPTAMSSAAAACAAPCATGCNDHCARSSPAIAGSAGARAAITSAPPPCPDTTSR